MRYDFAGNSGAAKRRIICFIMGLILLVASIVPAGFSIFATETDSGYSNQNIEVHPNEEDPDKTVTLEGLMPKNASVEVIDVTDDFVNNSDADDIPVDNGDAAEAIATATDPEYEKVEASGEGKTATASDAEDDITEDEADEYVTIAAYDITIKDGKKEYQPTEKRPIKVEIADDRISDDKPILVYHIKDDGEREEITDITVSDGCVSFDATGFSVYEIVEFADADDQIAILRANGEKGFYVAFYCGKASNNTNGPYYFNGGIKEFSDQGGRTGLTVTNVDPSTEGSTADKLYFEAVGTGSKFYIYTKDGNDKKYLKGITGDFGDAKFSALGYARSKKEASEFTLTKSGNRFNINTEGYYWVSDNNNNVQSVVGYKQSSNVNFAWMEILNVEDAYDQEVDTYGLMNYTGGTHGYALMADSSIHSLLQVVTHQTASNKDGTTLYVDEGSEITAWTFHRMTDGTFKLSAVTNNGIKYLAVNGDSLILVDSSDDAAAFEMIKETDGRIQLENNGKYIAFNMNDDGLSESSSFVMSSTTSQNTYLNLVDTMRLGGTDSIVSTADRVSVSGVEDGAKVIVYTRIWNDDQKRYDIYAVDHDGTLFQCYPSGGKIVWLGNGTDSLEWTFIEHRDSVTKEVNYYYELYNEYSDKYIAPQKDGNQTLSDNTIGINMPGRRDGEFYTDIVAWDEHYYTYVGMKPNEDNTRLVPCVESASVPFYFATLEELPLNKELHTVPTINNYDYGIIVKMQDFGLRKDMSDFLGTDNENLSGGIQNILSTNLGPDGYPTVAIEGQTHSGESLKGLYTEPVEVNNLFIKSIYEAGGYFEFDSCQNFATLCDDNGNLKGTTTYIDTKGEVHEAIDFTVYRELGTSDNSTKSATRKHGLFLPYDTIVGKDYSKYHQNEFSALCDIDGTYGRLPEDDPRKYEKLYNVGNKKNQSNPKDNIPNYYNGMEVEASFVQTISGLDAWGHDIIFEFTGDDDFWLYVDGELIIDLGGIHSALAGSVNFRTGDVTVKGETKKLKDIFKENYTNRYKAEHGGAEPSPELIKKYLANYFQPDEKSEDGFENIFADYSVHKMRIFYMERGAGSSNLHMRFNLASVKPGQVVVSKSITGTGAELLDTDFLEYPFQIYYTIPDPDYPDNPDKVIEKLLGNDDEHVRVSYLGSNQPVTFVSKYRPPGFEDKDAYSNVYFINPTKNAEIAFPDETIKYRIVECAVDSSVYGEVLINGKPVPDNQVSTTNNLRSYSSDLVTAETRPTISFENVVNDDVIKDLFITKRLIDEDGKDILDDPATFSFRLYLSAVDVENINDLQRVNMYNYYVVKKVGSEYYLCVHDHDNTGFIQTSIVYNHENIAALKEEAIDGYTIDDVTYTTSGFGAISGIPSGYTICVPGLPVGSIFKVTEDINSGYGLDSYEMVEGEKVIEGEAVEIPSYDSYLDQDANVGKVIADANPQVDVLNKSGFGLTVKKKWSDIDITTGHDPIYVAVYVDNKLLEGTVRKIVSPETSTYYFWTSLEKNADGSARTSFDGYAVKEVVVSGDYTVAEDGTVTGYDKVFAFEATQIIPLHAIRTAEATPQGEAPEKEYQYSVSYEQGDQIETTRTDIINNTRIGGLEIRLFKWNSSVPLAGGKFTLTDSNNNQVGKYTSDNDGVVKILYRFERNEVYTLTQTAAPDGYVGLQKTLKFKVNTDDTVTLLYEDGEQGWGTIDADDKKWADWSKGYSGIVAFVDIYNKPFSLKITKVDETNNNLKLSSAHFALYKQMNSSINGYYKSDKPMAGFEDLVTFNGSVEICGTDSGRTIHPGDKGTVYFLTETVAPPNYLELDDDIVFHISPIGKPSIINGLDDVDIVETGDAFIYTLNVKDSKKDPNINYLYITKSVKGNHGNKNKEFTFTFKIDGDNGTTEYEWKKNAVAQTPIHSGETFLMKDSDSVMIALPTGVRVTISENNEGYISTFKLNGEEVDSINFLFNGDTMLEVINTREGIVPTGIETNVSVLIVVAVLLIAAMLLFLKGRHRRYGE